MGYPHYDVLIIGGGPSGISAASMLALHTQKVAIINEGSIMGYGIEGAFKSKAGYEIAREYLHVKYRRDVYGKIPELNFARLKKGVQQSASTLTEMISKRLSRLNIEVINGRAKFIDTTTLAVGDKRYSAEKIIIAVGTRPRILPNMAVDENSIITSDEVINIQESPKSILILGAGVIGCEFASMFNAVGSKVYLVDTKPNIMSNEDGDISEFIENSFNARGINIIPSSRYQKFEHQKGSVVTTLSSGTIKTDLVLLAIGRTSNTNDLNLEVTGVELDSHNYIKIDANAQTNIPNIYAVGDIGNRNVPSDLSLVHVAEAEGRCAAAHILDMVFPQGLDHIPYIIFTIPMLAGAGITETSARARYGSVRIGKYPYARNHRAHAIQPPIGFVKLIVAPMGDDRILGVRAIGPDADSIVGAVAIMIERGLPYTYILESIFPHPSLLECLKGCAHIISGNALEYEKGEELSSEEALFRKRSSIKRKQN